MGIRTIRDYPEDTSTLGDNDGWARAGPASLYLKRSGYWVAVIHPVQGGYSLAYLMVGIHVGGSHKYPTVLATLPEATLIAEALWALGQ